MSSNSKSLGRLERVDLRDVWDREAGDFTPWLATKENLALLGDVLGIELELVAQEQNVGPFRADILCKNTVPNGNSVVKPGKPPAGNGWTFSVGRADFWLGAVMNTPKHWIRVGVACNGKDVPAYFQLLEKEKATIEQEIGCALEWEELPGKSKKRISLRKCDTDPADRDNWGHSTNGLRRG